eukprot:scaffold55712_cov18-Tisochrysis_lutea.AAC.2
MDAVVTSARVWQVDAGKRCSGPAAALGLEQGSEEGTCTPEDKCRCSRRSKSSSAKAQIGRPV